MQSGNESFGFELSFWIAPWNRDEFLQTARSLTGLSDDKPACNQACFEKVGADSWFLWREFCDSRESLETRLRSPTIKTLLGAIEVLGTLDRLESVKLVDATGPGVGNKR